MGKNENFGSNFISRHSFALAMFFSVVAFVLACGGLVVANGETIRPDDSHIVNVTVDDHEEVVPTRAQTVGELLPKLSISIGPEDVVEPSIDTTIDSDNFRISILKAKPTTIVDGTTTQTMLSPFSDPREVVKKAGYTLNDADIVKQEYPGDPAISRILGRKVVIDRSLKVMVNLYGTAIEKHTHLDTVSDLLNDMNIVAASDDTVMPNGSTELTDGMLIFITKMGKQVVNVEEAMPFPTDTIDDPTMNYGTQKVSQEGSNGKKIVTYELELANGAEVSRRVIQETVTIAPVVRKVVRGTRPLFADYNADGIPARVFCGSPKQNNWKNINVGNAAAGRSLAAERGWTGSEFDALLELFACESSWNERAGNPVSGAYGIPQAWPASKMAGFGDDYMTNPVTQLRWGLNYIAGRYGTPSAALAFHYRTNYY